MTREAAEPVIEDIRPDAERAGVGADLEIDARDTKSTTASGENYNVMWARAFRQDTGERILLKCIIIAPGDTVTIDDSYSNADDLDGEFDMPSSDVGVDVEVGGVNEADLTGCEFAPSDGFTNDTATHTIESFDRDAVSVTGCGANGAGPSDPVTLTATIDNPNTVGAEVSPTWTVDGQFEFDTTATLAGNETRTIEATASPPSGGWPTGDLPVTVDLGFPSMATNVTLSKVYAADRPNARAGIR